MDKLIVKLRQERNIIYGWIIHQDESLRNKRWLNFSTTIIESPNGFKIISSNKPGLSGMSFCIRGKNKKYDNHAFSVEFNSIIEAHQFAILLRDLIDRINGKSNLEESKEWGNETEFNLE